VVFLAFGALAVAAWLLPASIHVVGWKGATPIRIALLGHWSSLAMWIVGAAAAAGVVVVALRRRLPEHLSLVSTVSAPLTLLYGWVIPYIPWIADGVPLTLALAGPLRWGVAGIALLGAALMTLSARNPARGAGRCLRWGRSLCHGLLARAESLSSASLSLSRWDGPSSHHRASAATSLTTWSLRIA